MMSSKSWCDSDKQRSHYSLWRERLGLTVPFVIFLHDFEGERQTGVLASEEIISAVAVSVNELLARVLKASITAMFILRINMKSPSDKTHRELSPGSAFPPLHSTQGGQSGNMNDRSGVLHSQEGDGFDMLQFPLRKMSTTDWSTGGVNHSEPLGEHGNFLRENNGWTMSI